MRVTIIVDASYCSSSRAAGFGYWIASERGKMGGGGSMRIPVENSTAAEMLAVCNSLHVARNSDLIQPGDHILIQTDCVAAIEGLKTDFHRQLKVEQEKEARRFLMRFRREHQLTLSFRHVKGHSGRREARYVTNHLCDKRAKAGMRKAREMMKEQA